MLHVESEAPSHDRPPMLLTRDARAQSSITSLRMAAIPPAFSNAWGRTRMQPPAAPAVARRASAIQLGGYSLKKKKTKAGIRNFSAVDSQCSFTMNDAKS